MEDMGANTQGLALFSAGLAALREAMGLMGKASQTEAIGKLNDVQIQLTGLLQIHTDLIQHNYELQERIRELEKELQEQGSVQFHYDSYWKSDAEGKLDGPFLLWEWEEMGKLVRMRSGGQGKQDTDKPIAIFQKQDDWTVACAVPISFIKERCTQQVIDALPFL